MYDIGFYITIGKFQLRMFEKLTIKKNVESLAGTAAITLPGSAYNVALDVESKIAEGDEVLVRFGYDAQGMDLPLEFEGYVESIAADDGSIVINCEDEIYKMRITDLKDAVLPGISVKGLLEHVLGQMDGNYTLACDYEFKYDKFTIQNATAFDVLKKVQEETGANIYLERTTLHVHPQYAQIGDKVIYDFARNIEKSALKYKDAKRRKFMVTVKGTDWKGRTVKVEKGTPGGDKITLNLPGVSDKQTMENRADEVLKQKAYSGYEGDITTWLVPFVKPTDQAEIRDADYEYKTGTYYVVAVETNLSDAGGSRKVTIGAKLEGNG
ncbi:MAG: hypothetical protein LUF04_16175 [Bacteroides sp.]|nr:hypothetical protein [Bacteroides sp.]